MVDSISVLKSFLLHNLIYALKFLLDFKIEPEIMNYGERGNLKKFKRLVKSSYNKLTAREFFFNLLM
jgi:hypothetical protein